MQDRFLDYYTNQEGNSGRLVLRFALRSQFEIGMVQNKDRADHFSATL